MSKRNPLTARNSHGLNGHGFMHLTGRGRDAVQIVSLALLMALALLAGRIASVW